MRPTVKYWPGRRFARLVVKSTSFDGKYSWAVCDCDCGGEIKTRASSLQDGYTKSCGCLQSEAVAIRSYRHGLAARGNLHSLYPTWRTIKARCRNKNYKHWKDYGGRGIDVCDRWFNSFASFLEDMGEKPSKKHQVERKNNNLGYNKENCIWATGSENCRNRRNTIFIKHDGQTKTIMDWSDHTGISRSCISGRLLAGWTIKDALTIPSGTRRL